jgi:hypothetical protein
MTHKLTYLYKNSKFLFLFNALNFFPGSSIIEASTIVFSENKLYS